jgi:membrane protein
MPPEEPRIVRIGPGRAVIARRLTPGMRRAAGIGRRLVARVRGSLPGQVVRRVQQDNGTSWAALIAWSGLQSLFPIALALAAILGVVLGAVGVDSRLVYDAVAAAIPDQAGRQQVLEALQGVKTQTGLFAVLAIVGFLWTASSLFGTMEEAFNAIIHVPTRGFVRQKLMAVLMMLIFTVLAGAAIVSSALLPVLGGLPGLGISGLTQGAASGVIRFVFGSAAGFLLFFVIYYVVPNREQEVRQVWPGALFAGLAFEVVTLAFPLYLYFAGPSMNRYGKTFGLLFVLMVFFYLVGLVTVVGMELNAVLRPPPDAAPRPE